MSMTSEISRLINRGDHICRNFETTKSEADPTYRVLKCLDCKDEVLREVPRTVRIQENPEIITASIFTLDEEIPPIRLFALISLLEKLKKVYFTTDAVYPGLLIRHPQYPDTPVSILLINDGHIQEFVWDSSTEEWKFGKDHTE